MGSERAQRVRQKLDGARLRTLRCARGISLEEGARVLQLTADAVRAKELGVEPLLVAEFWRFCRGVGLSMAEAYGGDRGADYTPPPQREQRLQRKFFGAALATARDEAGMSLDAAAELAGMPPQRLRLGEMGEAELTLAEAEALAEGYGVGPESLFAGPPDGEAPRRPAAAAERAQDAGAAIPSLPSDVAEFLARPDAERTVRAAIALAQLDAAALTALDDALLYLRGG